MTYGLEGVVAWYRPLIFSTKIIYQSSLPTILLVVSIQHYVEADCTIYSLHQMRTHKNEWNWLNSHTFSIHFFLNIPKTNVNRDHYQTLTLGFQGLWVNHSPSLKLIYKDPIFGHGNVCSQTHETVLALLSTLFPGFQNSLNAKKDCHPENI